MTFSILVRTHEDKMLEKTIMMTEEPCQLRVTLY